MSKRPRRSTIVLSVAALGLFAGVSVSAPGMMSEANSWSMPGKAANSWSVTPAGSSLSDVPASAG
jgi:hypothetical protein